MRRIRWKEAMLQVYEGGRRQVGSFAHVTNFEVTPDAEISKTKFIGEKRATPDLDVSGHDFSFVTHVTSREFWDLWQRIQRAEEQGVPMPVVTLAVTHRYRTGGILTITLHGDVILKLDSASHPEGDFVNANWSGFARFADGL